MATLFYIDDSSSHVIILLSNHTTVLEENFSINNCETVDRLLVR